MFSRKISGMESLGLLRRLRSARRAKKVKVDTFSPLNLRVLSVRLHRGH